MDCAKALVFMCPEIDDELPVTDSAILQEHVSACSSCNDEWEALLLVDRSVKAVVDRVKVPAGLEDRILASVLREHNERARAGRKVKIWGFSTLAIAACLCVFFFSPNLVGEPLVSAETLVNETADGSRSASQENFKHIDGFKFAIKSERSNLLSLISRANMRHIAGLKIVAFDQYRDNSGKKILRACYQSSTDKSFCIDCYCAPTGYLSFSQFQEIRIAGKLGRFGKVGNHNVVILSENGSDYVYASPLDRGRLIAMISKSS